MRLEKIKLVGFKSFIDPTIVHFPKNLTGIVGPNGCGKSNIIDAVRWVMGESSAKQLRGESITDVIFNGSTERKPIGQASVELIFDNCLGKIGGEFANYNQIGIKRIVTRDAQSTYYLNNTKCRRRDITDIFLGTGLGSRSYSIIEQGMITRIIEAKPEELRAHFEEVAGISKYRERRRETENRIGHTRENLSRVNDLREEIGKQLERLKRQAKAAERYKILKEEERLLKAQMLALRWRKLDNDASTFDVIINKQEVLLESQKAELQRIETEVEKQLCEKNQFSDEFNEIQGKYYRIGSEIARLEQAIAHHKERINQLSFDLEQASHALGSSKESIASDQAKLADLTEKLTYIEPEADKARKSVENSSHALSEAETAMSQWQLEWEKFNQLAAESSKLAQVELTRIEHIEQQQVRATQRLKKIDEESQCFNIHQLKIERDEFQDKIHELTQSETNAQNEYHDLIQQISAKKEEKLALDKALNETRNDLQISRGRLASLTALQQAALGQGKSGVTGWLEKHQLAHNKRLGQEIKVEKGWETALETVLGDHLEAVCIKGIDAVTSVLGELKEGVLALFDIDTYLKPQDSRHGHELLSSKLRSKLPADSLLNGVYAVTTLAEALALRDSLSHGESVITIDGVWLGRNWLRVSKEAGEQTGVIQREEEIKNLEEIIAAAESQKAHLEAKLEQSIEALNKLEEKYENIHLTISEIKSKLSEINATIHIRQSQIDQAEKRLAELLTEAAHQREQIDLSKDDLSKSRHNWQIAMQAIEDDANRREQLLVIRDDCRRQLDDAKTRAEQDKAKGHQLELERSSYHTQLESLKQAIERTQNQMSSLTKRKEQLYEQLSVGDAPIQSLQIELEKALEQRLEIEKELNNAKQQVDNLAHKLQTLAQDKHRAEIVVQEARTALEEKRLQGRELTIRQAALKEQLAETQFELDPLLAALSAEATEESWQVSIEEMATRISRLGPINLAAIEEFEQESERKEYLDAQNADLEEALATLQNAIRKIDRETRQRFKETFDTVNQHFQTLFPKVFGGGTAYLEMTSEDLLETGISVMARPPGKKITSIHLLSGGEKALTAISLIFSMFQLNPAPFCLLDEVDAPLDDNNVGRFCDLVKEMSQQIQFLFISHNKLAIEIADHLVGVTMNEPGVSRIVAVDLDAAVAMAKQ